VYRRRSARVLLLDGTGRILLLRSLRDSSQATVGHDWLTPGGGVGKLESLARAAAREPHEEIGLAVTPRELGRPVAYTAGYAELGWARGVFRDDFFYHQVARHDVDISRMEARERSSHAGHRWWTLDEIASTAETVFPFGLAGLLTDLLAGRFPQHPIMLPWHH
jgi:8-oxo-dGTP pyrophosphatase MutT (NUDIX family)